MKIYKKIASAIATIALLLSSVSPAFAATIEISGNGSSSDNSAAVTTTNTTTVSQSNVANISNNVIATADTGGNSANENTGGNTTVSTGNATSDVTISNMANANVASVSNCGTCSVDSNVTISGNGADSANSARVDNSNDTTITQQNTANIANSVANSANTGDNQASRNTGGAVSITTGSATTNTTVSSSANANVASVGGGDGTGSSVNLQISGNGFGSDNSIDLSNNMNRDIAQGNVANISNEILSEAETGDNEANENTDGDVSITSGNATASTLVDNAVNFNFADLSCCLISDMLVKISGNGAESVNSISADLGNSTSVVQDGKEFDNLANLANLVLTEAESGDNIASRNTGAVLNDPLSVMTGSADQSTTINNMANANVVSSNGDLSLPDNFIFDLSGLMELLHLV